MQMSRLLAAAIAFSTLAPSLQAADAPLPNPGEVKSLAVHPAKVGLTGSDDAAQLVVTATLADGREVDLTHDVKYAVADGKAATVLSSRPRGAAGQRHDRDHRDLRRQDASRCRSTTERSASNLPINFANQIVPIFTKLGCNSRRLPRQGRRPERLHAVAARLRAGARLHDAREGRPRPAAVPGRPGRTACCCSRRPAAWPTAAASAWSRTPTSTSSSAAGSPPACPSASQTDPVVDQDHASTPSTAS